MSDDEHGDQQRADDALGDAGLAPGRTTAARSGSRRRALRTPARPATSTSASRMTRTASENSRLPAAAGPGRRSPRRRGRVPRSERWTAPLVGGRADGRHRRLLVPLPRAADERVADDVEHEGDDEQQQPDEEQALERGASPATWSLPVASAAIAAVIVWPGSSGSKLSTRAAGGAGGERDDHRLADRRGWRPGSARRRCPRSAAGTTTRRLVVSRRAPRPYDASRKRPRHGPHRVLGDGRDERDRQDADADARPPGR